MSTLGANVVTANAVIAHLDSREAPNSRTVELLDAKHGEGFASSALARVVVVV